MSHPLKSASLFTLAVLLSTQSTQKIVKLTFYQFNFSAHVPFNALSTGLPNVFVQSVHAGCTVGANACLHTSTFLRPFLSHSAKLGRGWAVNLHSYTPLLPNTHQTGLILLFATQSCCIVVNNQHFSDLGDSYVLTLVLNLA